MIKNGKFTRLNVEVYGGPILSTWLDRPLGLAGRIIYRENGLVKTKAVNIDEDFAIIPSVAIHMNREANNGYKNNPQVDMIPLVALGDDFDLINICTNNTYHDTPYAQLEFNYNNNGITTREITTGFASGENIMIVVFSQPLSSLGDYLIESLDIITSVVISDFNADSEVHTSTSSHDGELSSRSNAEISNQEIQSAPTTGQKNALSTALQYLSVLSFSRSGLIDQLEYEGFTNEEAVYAVDNCGADWNEQASKCAKHYLELMPFSRQELVDQLLYEGFTQSQAEYGVSQNGY